MSERGFFVFIVLLHPQKTIYFLALHFYDAVLSWRCTYGLTKLMNENERERESLRDKTNCWFLTVLYKQLDLGEFELLNGVWTQKHKTDDTKNHERRRIIIMEHYLNETNREMHWLIWFENANGWPMSAKIFAPYLISSPPSCCRFLYIAIFLIIYFPHTKKEYLDFWHWFLYNLFLPSSLHS